MPKTQKVSVFLSHSHADRRTATTLQAVLENYGLRAKPRKDAEDALLGREDRL